VRYRTANASELVLVLRHSVSLLLGEEQGGCLVERSRQPRIDCPICNQPIDLQTDTCTDENGKAVHQDCYMKRLHQGNSSESAAD
jgi:hypothetical protein